MRSWGLLISMLVSAPGAALGQAWGPCRAALAMTKRATGVPDRLMQAMAVVESGRRDGTGRVAPWPWTINVEGTGEVFESKAAAIAAVTAHRAGGARSIDVGCMQVNLMHHPNAFPSLEDAFDPAINARYAARFLQQLLAQTGSWPRAVAGYHSLTPEVGGDYSRKVLAIWAQPEVVRGAAVAQAGTQGGAAGLAGVQAFASPGLPPPALPPPALPPAALPSAAAGAGGISVGSGARPGSGGGPNGGVGGGVGMTRRGLDSYRAAPVRLATAAPIRRS